MTTCMLLQTVLPAWQDSGHGTAAQPCTWTLASYSACAQDYMNIMQFLMKHWNISSRQGLSVEAQQAQEDVCKLETRCVSDVFCPKHMHLPTSRC